MTNILFLDLDGPAFPDVIIQYDPEQRKPYPGRMDFGDLGYWKMCERFKNMWTHMYSVFDFEVVISSSWRKYYEKPEYFTDLFTANGLPINLHKDWATKVTHRHSGGWTSYDSGYGKDCTRASEIFYWLRDHPEVTNFVIIDDRDSGYSLDILGSAWSESHNMLAGNIVLVDESGGINSHNIKDMYDIMKQWPMT